MTQERPNIIFTFDADQAWNQNVKAFEKVRKLKHALAPLGIDVRVVVSEAMANFLSHHMLEKLMSGSDITVQDVNLRLGGKGRSTRWIREQPDKDFIEMLRAGEIENAPPVPSDEAYAEYITEITASLPKQLQKCKDRVPAEVHSTLIDLYDAIAHAMRKHYPQEQELQNKTVIMLMTYHYFLSQYRTPLDLEEKIMPGMITRMRDLVNQSATELTQHCIEKNQSFVILSGDKKYRNAEGQYVLNSKRLDEVLALVDNYVMYQKFTEEQKNTTRFSGFIADTLEKLYPSANRITPVAHIILGADACNSATWKATQDNVRLLQKQGYDVRLEIDEISALLATRHPHPALMMGEGDANSLVEAIKKGQVTLHRATPEALENYQTRLIAAQEKLKQTAGAELAKKMHMARRVNAVKTLAKMPDEEKKNKLIMTSAYMHATLEEPTFLAEMTALARQSMLQVADTFAAQDQRIFITQENTPEAFAAFSQRGEQLKKDDSMQELIKRIQEKPGTAVDEGSVGLTQPLRQVV